MARKLLFPLGVAFGLVCAAPVSSLTIDLSIPEFVGHFESTFPEVVVDFGQAFSDVTGITLTITGSATPVTREFCLDSVCSPYSSPVLVRIGLVEPSQPSTGITFSTSLPSSGVDTKQVESRPLFHNLVFLEDGIATAGLGFFEPAPGLGRILSPGSITITQAVLHLNGIPVPEPSSGLLLLSGFVLLHLATAAIRGPTSGIWTPPSI